MKYEFFVGSYGKKEEESITKFSLDGDTGEVEKLYACRGVENPSWLALNTGRNMLYAVEERKPEGGLCVFEVRENGLELRGSVSAKGADPCHICMDEREEYLFVSNYTSGSLTVCRLDAAGMLAEITDFVQHEGCGVNPLRQEGPHVHFAKTAGEQVFVVDLGTDRVFVYELERKKGTLKDTGKYITFPAGEGPRHLEFHPQIPGLLYGVCELGNKLAVFRERDGSYVPEEMLSTLPASCGESSTAAALRICGNLLLVSNRGYDSLAVYVLGDRGNPVLNQILPTGGKTPRDFAFFGDYVVVANQNSDKLTILRADREKGKLEQTGKSVPVCRPSCICRV